VIDGEKRIPTGTIPVGSRPEAIAVDPASGLVFVANTHGNTITVIDGATKKVRATVAAGKSPYALAFNPKAGKLHVANLDDVSFTTIDIQRMVGGAR
jgi:YVTN family beta-propeller protein